MTFDFYVQYFKTIAETHKDIGHTDQEKHFYRLNISEVQNTLRSIVPGKVFMLESYEGQLIDQRSDNVRDEQLCAFMILGHVPPGDFDQENIILGECKRIGFEVISKLYKDKKDNVAELRGFDIGSVHYMKVGPIFDNYFGYRFTHSINDKANVAYDPAKWL